MLPRRRGTTAFRNLPPIYEIVDYRKGRRDKRFRTRRECFMCFTEMMANCIQSYMTECLFGL